MTSQQPSSGPAHSDGRHSRLRSRFATRHLAGVVGLGVCSVLTIAGFGGGGDDGVIASSASEIRPVHAAGDEASDQRIDAAEEFRIDVFDDDSPAPEREQVEVTTVAAAASDIEPVDPPVAERRRTWNTLADCESGEWDGSGRPVPGSRTWDYGLGPGENGLFEGGLQFHPDTWDGFRDADMPEHAGEATPEQQIAVAERVLAAQGWNAWPVCSKKMGIA